MSFYTQTTKTVAIDEDNSVVVRALLYAERQTTMSNAMTTVIANGQERITVDMLALQRAQMHVGIVSWSGPGFEDRPVTPANIDALPAAVADIISEALDELNKKHAPAEKKALTSGTND